MQLHTDCGCTLHWLHSDSSWVNPGTLHPPKVICCRILTPAYSHLFTILMPNVTLHCVLHKLPTGEMSHLQPPCCCTVGHSSAPTPGAWVANQLLTCLGTLDVKVDTTWTGKMIFMGLQTNNKFLLNISLQQNELVSVV